MAYPTGKIDHSLVSQLISQHLGASNPNVKVGPAFGVDVARADLDNGLSLLLTSDPLSLIPALGMQESAWLSVHLMANDMATTGFAPQFGQFVLNLPDSMSVQDFESYWQYIHQFSKAIGLSITGGHTGFDAQQRSTIVGGGTLISVAPSNQVLTSNKARQGDVILVTKHCALSAAAILALSYPQTIRNRAGQETLQRVSESFYRSSSLPEALIAAKHGQAVSAMHDVTEGGVLGAIYELAVASGNGAIIYDEQLPVDPFSAAVCELFDLDQRRCIGAGAMLISCAPAQSHALLTQLEQANIPCTVVGELTSAATGIKIVERGNTIDLTYSTTDPYWAAYFNALTWGWK